MSPSVKRNPGSSMLRVVRYPPFSPRAVRGLSVVSIHPSVRALLVAPRQAPAHRGVRRGRAQAICRRSATAKALLRAHRPRHAEIRSQHLGGPMAIPLRGRAHRCALADAHRVERRAVAPKREENPGQPAGERHHRDPRAPPRRQAGRPPPEWRRRRMKRARHTPHAACTSNQRSRVLPALVSAPRRWRSPELCSRGTSPRYAATWPARANRVTSSSGATKATAVTGPTPGVVASRRATGSAVSRRAAPASAAAMAALSGASSVTSGATTAPCAGVSSTWARRRGHDAALPLGTRMPSRRRTARITDRYPVRVCTSAARTASSARTARGAAATSRPSQRPRGTGANEDGRHYPILRKL